MTTGASLAAAFAMLASAAPPLAADGHPDLTGSWSNASLTWLERPPGIKTLVLSEAEARRLAVESPWVTDAEEDARPTAPSTGAPEANGPVGGYNAFWMDAGSRFARVRGEYRSSWIVDPPDGRLPLTEAGRRRSREAAATRNRQDPAGPEDLSPNDRCIIASRGSAGPGLLNNLYNSNYLIVQAPRAVVIVSETGFNARTIPILPGKAAAQAAHGPPVLARWLGDSTAWWEGDTLVVETVDVNPQQGRFGPIFLSPQGRVTERFTRVSPDEILHTFTVEDPVYYTRTWRAETTLTALRGQVYEFACHEGNYAIANILAGARAEEKAGAAK